MTFQKRGIRMAQILVRNLDKVVVDRLKKLARKEGRSLQSEVKAILEQAVNVPTVDIKSARTLVDQIRLKFRGRKFPDTVELIREDRDR
jgi:plasmid stability protein